MGAFLVLELALPANPTAAAAALSMAGGLRQPAWSRRVAGAVAVLPTKLAHDTVSDKLGSHVASRL